MFTTHGKGTSTMAFTAGKRRVHTTFEDGVEMVEEYDPISLQLMVRKWKAKSTLGRDRGWEFEIGDEPNEANTAQKIALFATATNPVFVTRDNKDSFEWRIRNLPYPKDVYQLSIDQNKQEIVLRTTNRKYYKRFRVPSLVRHGVELDEMSLSMDYSNNTLVIQYDKPEKILEMEQARRLEFQKKNVKEGDVDCKQQ